MTAFRVLIDKPVFSYETHADHLGIYLSTVNSFCLIVGSVLVHLPSMQPCSSFGAASEGAHWLRQRWPDGAVSVSHPPNSAAVFPNADNSIIPGNQYSCSYSVNIYRPVTLMCSRYFTSCTVCEVPAGT